MSGTPWSDARVHRELASGINGVMKAANCTLASAEISYSTPVERAQASADASRYRRLAKQMTSPADAAGYRELARQALEGAGLGGSHRARAEEYQRKAALATDPRDRSGYEQLAAQERQR